jgi:hypothetical protein
MRSPVLTAAALILSSVLNAQWLKYPSPGIPRLPDGKPDLSAPAPKTADGKPDLSGIWGRGGGIPKMADVPLQPAARALVEHRDKSDNKDGPLTSCLPTFFIHIAPFTLYKIVQTPGLVVMLSDGAVAPCRAKFSLTDVRFPKIRTRPGWVIPSVTGREVPSSSKRWVSTTEGGSPALSP